MTSRCSPSRTADTAPFQAMSIAGPRSCTGSTSLMFTAKRLLGAGSFAFGWRASVSAMTAPSVVATATSSC